MRSGRVPIVSNGAAERFTQAVRIPAALAPTLSNALQVTSRTCPDRQGQPLGRVPVHSGRRLERPDLIDADPLAEELSEAAAGQAVPDHGGAAVGEDRELIAQAGEGPQRRDRVRERRQMVIKPDEPLGLAARQARPGRGKREVERARRHPPEILVLPHRGEPE